MICVTVNDVVRTVPKHPLVRFLAEILLVYDHLQLIELQNYVLQIEILLNFLGPFFDETHEFSLLFPAADLHQAWHVVMQNEEEFLAICNSYEFVELYIICKACWLQLFWNVAQIQVLWLIVMLNSIFLLFISKYEVLSTFCKVHSLNHHNNEETVAYG